MKPQKPPDSPTDDLFRHRLENLIDPRHELVKLSELIDWDHFDQQWGGDVLRSGTTRDRHPTYRRTPLSETHLCLVG